MLNIVLMRHELPRQQRQGLSLSSSRKSMELAGQLNGIMQERGKEYINSSCFVLIMIQTEHRCIHHKSSHTHDRSCSKFGCSCIMFHSWCRVSIQMERLAFIIHHYTHMTGPVPIRNLALFCHSFEGGLCRWFP